VLHIKSFLLPHAVLQFLNARLFVYRVKGESGAAGGDTALRVALPDPAQSVLEVIVTEVVQCGHFYAQCIDHNHIMHVRNVNALLNPGSKLLVSDSSMFSVVVNNNDM